jgi:hypothetical protein
MYLIPALLVLFSTIATASLSPSCMKVLGSLSNRVDTLTQSYHTEICAKGCQPAVADWDQWTYQYAFLPFVKTVTTEMQLSSRFRDTFVQLGDDVAAVVKRDCEQLLHGKHFCAESDALTQWGSCFKRNFAIVAMKNSLKLLPLVTSEVCQGDYEYLNRDELWEVVLPGYMKEYAATCQKETVDREIVDKEEVDRKVEERRVVDREL